jgi:hypothetical protein
MSEGLEGTLSSDELPRKTYTSDDVDRIVGRLQREYARDKSPDILTNLAMLSYAAIAFLVVTLVKHMVDHWRSYLTIVAILALLVSKIGQQVMALFRSVVGLTHYNRGVAREIYASEGSGIEEDEDASWIFQAAEDATLPPSSIGTNIVDGVFGVLDRASDWFSGVQAAVHARAYPVITRIGDGPTGWIMIGRDRLEIDLDLYEQLLKKYHMGSTEDTLNDGLKEQKPTGTIVTNTRLAALTVSRYRRLLVIFTPVHAGGNVAAWLSRSFGRVFGGR